MAQPPLFSLILVLGCASLVSARFLPISPPLVTKQQPITAAADLSVNLDPDPFETLKKNGLPVGLLPKSVSKAEINDQGWFRVQLPSTCRTSVHNTGEIPLYYSTVLTGRLQYGIISNVKGISAKPPELPFWVSVRSIYVDNAASSLIHFSVGFGISEQLPRAAFEDFPVCQSGVDALPENQDEDTVEFHAQEEPFEVAIQEAIKVAEEEEAAQVAAAENGDEQDPALVVVEAMTLDGEEEIEASLTVEEQASSEVQATADDPGDADKIDERLMDEATTEQQGGELQDEVGVAAA
ncbi:unnamed protein product [Closterium sp. NIES-53]